MRKVVATVLGGLVVASSGCAELANSVGAVRILAAVNPDRVQLSKPRNGIVTISGLPGAVSGEATLVQVVVSHFSGLLMGEISIGRESADVSPGGGFFLAIGSASKPVVSGDDLYLIPATKTATIGRRVTLKVP